MPKEVIVVSMQCKRNDLIKKIEVSKAISSQAKIGQMDKMGRNVKKKDDY